MSGSAKVDINYKGMDAGIKRAFDASVLDMHGQAVRNAPRRSGRLRSSSRLRSRGSFFTEVVFNTPYAKARERGAYIEHKYAPRLAFMAGGRFVRPKWVRQKAKPYLAPAGRLWRTRFFVARCREVFK